MGECDLGKSINLLVLSVFSFKMRALGTTSLRSLLNVTLLAQIFILYDSLNSISVPFPSRIFPDLYHYKKESLISIPTVFNSQLSYSNALSWTVVKLAVVFISALLHDTDRPVSYGSLNALMASLWLLLTHVLSRAGYRWYAQHVLNLLAE